MKPYYEHGERITNRNKKLIVVVCECGGHHTKSDCHKAWAELNRWFYEPGQPSAKRASNGVKG